MPLLERTPPRVVHPIPSLNHVVAPAQPSPTSIPTPTPTPVRSISSEVVHPVPNRQQPDSSKDDETDSLRQMLAALRQDLRRAQDAERRAKEEAEGWAAECEVLQRKQTSPRPTVGVSSASEQPTSSTAASSAEYTLLQLQRKDLQKAMAVLDAEQSVARVSTEYAGLLASTEPARARDTVTAVVAQFAGMRCEFAQRRAERKLQRLMHDSRQDLDHLNVDLASVRQQLEQERAHSLQLQVQLTKSHADSAELSVKKRKLNSPAVDLSPTTTEDPAPVQPKRGPGRPRKVVAETQKSNGPSPHPASLLLEEEELEEDEVERSILHASTARPRPRPVKAGSVRDTAATSSSSQPAPSKATKKPSAPVDSADSTFDKSPPKRKPASKGTQAADAPAAVSTVNRSRSNNKENVEPLDEPLRSMKKKAKAKAQESDEDAMENDSDDDFVSDKKRKPAAAAAQSKKRKGAAEEIVDASSAPITESITVPAVTPSLAAKKPKKQRRLGGANAGGGILGNGNGLSFLSGASTSAATGVLNAKTGGQTTVNEMRKKLNQDETALLNPSSELGLPLALSPLKPGSSTGGRGRGFGNLGRGLPSFLSRSGF